MEEKVAEIEEPLHKYKQSLLILPVEKLKVIEIQRKPSDYHIKRLSESIRKIGFIVPLIVIKRNGSYIIIDGQHRFLAAKQLGIEKLPCIEIPEKYANELMELNIEKAMSLKEKCYVSLNVYRILMNEKPDMLESDMEVRDAIEYPYFITLAIAYEMQPRFFGSAYESMAKRVDVFLDKPIEEAYAYRDKIAMKLIELDSMAREAMEKIEEMGISHPFLYKEIISFCNPIGRKRKVDMTMEELIELLRINLQELLKNPDTFREHKFEEI
ncbi:MAG: ParB-like nuclease domain-containing protein [Thermoplasmata archaeon]|nr:ParB-like nuclease domain-containing protein [Thermoplasmata archaeon]